MQMKERSTLLYSFFLLFGLMRSIACKSTNFFFSCRLPKLELEICGLPYDLKALFDLCCSRLFWRLYVTRFPALLRISFWAIGFNFLALDSMNWTMIGSILCILTSIRVLQVRSKSQDYLSLHAVRELISICFPLYLLIKLCKKWLPEEIVSRSITLSH